MKKGCVTIAVALYNPNQEWLVQQLNSLNAQSYSNIEILLCDDCPQHPIEESLIANSIINFPYKLLRNEKNIGIQANFQRLLEETTGEYLALCDQDDIWHVDKVQKMVQVMQQNPSCTMVYCDLALIDGAGNLQGETVYEAKKRETGLQGEHMAASFARKCAVYGCSTLLRTELAQRYLPIPTHTGHDHWLSLCAALNGEIVFLKEPLIDYRRHGNNNSGEMHGVATKQDYYSQRIEGLLLRMEEWHTALEDDKNAAELLIEVDKLLHWAQARKAWWLHGTPKNFINLVKRRNCSVAVTSFELALAHLPQNLFALGIKKIQENKI